MWSWSRALAGRVRQKSCSWCHCFCRFPFTEFLADRATVWRWRGSAGGRGPDEQVETMKTTATRMDRLTEGVKRRRRAPGSSSPVPALTTLSKSSTSTHGLFSTTNTDTIMSLARREREALRTRATGLTGAPRPQLLAGKPLTPCDSQLSHGSDSGQTHDTRALQSVCTQLHRLDGWKLASILDSFNETFSSQRVYGGLY